MIAIVDYGLGNIKAFSNVYKKLHIPVRIAKNAADLKGAEKIILPGVGAFDHAVELLESSGMRNALDELVLEKKVPVLGICVGMQILARSSQEGKLLGLGWINGEVKKFDTSRLAHVTHLPHMGWNDVIPTSTSALFEQLNTGSIFYFLHSYFFECDKKEDVIATTDYGGEFACAVNAGNVFGVQFHPEKSHQYGVQLLKNFANL